MSPFLKVAEMAILVNEAKWPKMAKFGVEDHLRFVLCKKRIEKTLHNGEKRSFPKVEKWPFFANLQKELMKQNCRKRPISGLNIKGEKTLEINVVSV